MERMSPRIAVQPVVVPLRAGSPRVRRISARRRAGLAVAGLALALASASAPGFAAEAAAGSAAETAILPPAPAWRGASEKLIVAADDPWITPAEAAAFATAPD